LQQIAGTSLLAAQIHPQPPGHIVEVAFALAQVGILDVIEYRGDLVEGALHGPLGVDPLAGDEIRRAADQHGVVEHQQLRIEDGRELRSFQLGNAAPNLVQLFARTSPRTFERRQLARHAVGRNWKADDLRALNGDQRGARRDAR
jgi:hypothetical protein